MECGDYFIQPQEDGNNLETNNRIISQDNNDAINVYTIPVTDKYNILIITK